MLRTTSSALSRSIICSNVDILVMKKYKSTLNASTAAKKRYVITTTVGVDGDDSSTINLEVALVVGWFAAVLFIQ
ncbi:MULTISPECIES: hypothetical protein [Candidatus Ichthyocystis]|uniref:hypothetical protein n=1 Tax=Candidatus Ichthyocystis TaxID=2929841 RepID=UPI0011462085|nr:MULTISPECIES: hypothetical protein [Ichthyocystis]